MSKEDLRRRDEFSASIQLTMKLYEAKNKECGGMLFASFGTGSSKFIIFPIPHSSLQRNEFLVLTSNGFKLVEVDIKCRDYLLAIQDHMLGRLGKHKEKSRLESLFRIDKGGSYDPKNERIRFGRYFIDNENLDVRDNWLSASTGCKFISGCRLTDPTGDKRYLIDAILKENLESVIQKQESIRDAGVAARL